MGLRAIIADLIVDATTAGKALLTAANAAAQRTLLGLGTSAVRDEGYFAIADTHAHTVINLDGTSIVDMDGNGNTRLTTAASKGIVLAPLNDTVSIIRGTAQPQTWQIANTWSASDDFELLRLSANTTEYRIMSIPGSSTGSNRPIKIGHSDGAGSFTAAVTVNINGTVTFPSSISASNLSGTNTGDQDLSSYATTAAVAAGYQPLDSDLTAIAALTTTSFGRGALEVANAGAFRTYIGAGTGTSNFDGAYSSLSGIPSTFTPASHTHGNITNAGAIGSTANLPVITTTAGALTVGAFGTGATDFCVGNDARLSDARTPTAHNQAWSTITSTPTSLAGYGITDAQGLDTQLTSLAGLTYTSNSLKVVRVNSGETGFELATISAGGGDAFVANDLDQFANVTQTAGQTLAITSSTTLSGGTHSGTNTGDQTSIAGITGTKAQFDTAVTDGNILYVGDAPTSHTHGNITNAGAIGSTALLPVITGTSGVLEAGSFGTTSGTFCQGNDARLSDARTPTAHTHPLSEISQSAATNNQVPQWNGSAWVPVTLSAGSGDALVANPLSQFAATTSAQLAGVISDETGTGLLPFATGATHSNMTVDQITFNETLGSEMVVDGAFAAPTQYTAATSGVNTTTDTITLSSNPGWAVNDIVQYHNGGGTAIAGLVHRGCYFIASNTAGVITVKTTTAGGAVNITGTGNNAQFFIKTNWFSGTSGTTGGVDSWDLSAGRAAKQVAGTATLRPAVALVPTPGVLYKIQYTVSNWTVAGTTVVFGGVTAQASTLPTSNGVKTLYVTAQTNGDLSLVPVTGMRADIDDISIRPVLSGMGTTGVPFNFIEALTDNGANEVAYCLNYTVNKTAGNDVGLQINMIDVSSPGTSLPFQIMLGTTSVFSVSNAGAVVVNSSVNCQSLTASGNISGAALTTTNFITNSYAGAASTAVIRTTGAILTGGTGTTNFPQFLQQPTAATGATTWSTAGTWHGVNTAAAFTGNFLDFRINGASPVFVVDSLGAVTASGGVNPRVTSVASSATPTPNFQTTDQYNVTALAADATFGAPTGTLLDGMRRFIRVKDNGTARLLSFNAVYRALGVTLPTTTVINKTLYLGMIYNAADTKWDIVAVGQEA